ncbi:MAG: putative membrane protein YfcA [Bradymonadia bacterium]|jgi:uncharacterized membrane protein YfcA
MMPLAFALSILMGISLGLMGGGGSVLAVPILLYVVGLAAKEAIAISLLIVGATSIGVTLQHGRKGNVEWKIGLVFGGFAMIGAFSGGWAAQFIPGTVLIVLFAMMMIVAGIAMLRGGKETKEPGKFSLGKAAAEGIGVGALTGLVGAGGGFMVVPALVLFGGLDMRKAVGTSTLVIAMKSFAAFGGYAEHVTVDWALAGSLTAFALVGSVIGSALVHRVSAEKLRKGFGVFVLTVAMVLVYGELSPELRQTIFADWLAAWILVLVAAVTVVAMKVVPQLRRAAAAHGENV